MTTTREHDQAVAARTLAATHLYEAEAALHVARQTDIDEWVRAASEKLHRAVLELEDAEANLGCDWSAAA